MLQKALDYVTKALSRAESCTDCLDSYLGPEKKDEKKDGKKDNKKDEKKCSGDNCDINIPSKALNKLPPISRIISEKDIGKPNNHHKIKKNKKVKNNPPEKEADVPGGYHVNSPTPKPSTNIRK